MGMLALAASFLTVTHVDRDTIDRPHLAPLRLAVSTAFSEWGCTESGTLRNPGISKSFKVLQWAGPGCCVQHCAGRARTHGQTTCAPAQELRCQHVSMMSDTLPDPSS